MASINVCEDSIFLVVQKNTVKVESHQKAKISFFFRWASSNLHESIVTFLQKSAAFYTEGCMATLLFHNIGVSPGIYNHTLKNYGFIWDTIFFICTRVHKQQNIIITQVRNTISPRRIYMYVTTLWMPSKDLHQLRKPAVKANFWCSVMATFSSRMRLLLKSDKKILATPLWLPSCTDSNVY